MAERGVLPRAVHGRFRAGEPACLDSGPGQGAHDASAEESVGADDGHDGLGSTRTAIWDECCGHPFFPHVKRTGDLSPVRNLEPGRPRARTPPDRETERMALEWTTPVTGDAVRDERSRVVRFSDPLFVEAAQWGMRSLPAGGRDHRQRTVPASGFPYYTGTISRHSRGGVGVEELPTCRSLCKFGQDRAELHRERLASRA
ncbi:hypothetical protein GCM10010219_25640 [Streptomyces netropsis]|nr:hypothetical protein GCM10010219_25640 [Streptomyces netropsis]